VRIAVLVVVVGYAGLAGCKLRIPGGRGTEVSEARQAAALAWVNALGTRDGDDERMHQLTSAALVFRTIGKNHGCEGPVAADTGFREWLACARARPDLFAFAGALQLYRQALAADPANNAAFKQYLPKLVGGDEAWSRFVGVEERRRAENAFAALRKEAGNDGDWVTITASWLYTTMVARVQVIGAAQAPRVHAVLVDVVSTSD
jgi:hypothetical protein